MNERNALICAAFLSGKTMAEIGKEHGVSRQRIDQILTLNNVNRSNGGKHKRKIIRKEIDSLKNIRQKNMICEIYGISISKLNRYKLLFLGLDGPENPLRAYVAQRRNARNRGIDWIFNFDQWWKAWRDSGMWRFRGKSLGRYVMARIGDIGPYSPENTKIVTISENVIEGHSFRNK